MQFMKITVLLLAVVLTSCSYIYGNKGFIKNRDSDYLQAKSVPPLKIPPGVAIENNQAHYPVSETDGSEQSKKPSLVPPGL